MGLKMKFGDDEKTLIMLVIFLIFMSIVISRITISLLTQDMVIGKVTFKERVVTGSNDGIDSFYLVSTKRNNGEIEVFQNIDSTIFWKFNSSDVQAQLEIGKSYEIDVSGFRIPFLSCYRNIIRVRPLETSK